MSVINEQEEKYRQDEERKRERDKANNKKKYWLMKLEEMGLPLSKIKEETQSKIVDFLEKVKEENEKEEKNKNEVRKRGNNLLNNYSKEKYYNESFIEIFNNIYKKMDVFEIIGYDETGYKIKENLKTMRKYTDPIEINNQLASNFEVNESKFIKKHCEYNYRYLEYIKTFQKNCLKKDKGYYRYILLNQNLYLWANKGIIYELENIYFARINSKEKREEYFIKVKNNLEKILGEFLNEENKLKKELNLDYKVVLFSFFSLKQHINKEKKELEKEKEILKREYQEVDNSKKELIELISTDYEEINSKDLKLEKKDNILKKKEKEIDELINILSKTDNGAVLCQTKEDKKMLYKLFYQDKMEYNGKKLSTIIKKILENEEKENSIHHNVIIDVNLKESEYDEYIDIINKMIKKERYYNYKKEDEYKWIIEIKELLDKISDIILRGICPRNINKKLLKLIERLQNINVEIGELDI